MDPTRAPGYRKGKSCIVHTGLGTGQEKSKQRRIEKVIEWQSKRRVEQRRNLEVPSSSTSVYVKMKKALRSISNLNPILQVLEIKWEILSHQGTNPKALGTLHLLCPHSLWEADRAPRSGRWFWTTPRSPGLWKPQKGPQSPTSVLPSHPSQCGEKTSHSPFYSLTFMYKTLKALITQA